MAIVSIVVLPLNVPPAKELKNAESRCRKEKSTCAKAESPSMTLGLAIT